MDKLPTSFSINCGYARVAALEYSFLVPGKHRSCIDKKERIDKFQTLFQGYANFARPPSFWQNGTISHFDRYCGSILDDFSMSCRSWKPKELRVEYTGFLSTKKWKALPQKEKNSHSLSKCCACAGKHMHLQKSYPRLPCFENSLIKLPLNESERTVTRMVLSDLNGSYKSAFNHSFTESVLKHCGTSEGIAVRETNTAKKRKRRDTQRTICSSINKSFGENAAIHFLASNESFSGYQRNRLSQSFDKCEVSKPKKRRISDSQLTQYKDIVQQKVSDWPEDKNMNWSELGTQCGVTTTNRGQIVKEIAEEIGIDLTLYEQEKSFKLRSSKAKLPGNEISVPSMPTLNFLKDDIKVLFDSGKLTLGEPCTPFALVKSRVVNGNLESTTSQVYGRKHPLLELRKRLLAKQEKFMRLLTDQEIDSLSLEDVKAKLQDLVVDITVINDHRESLKRLQRSRTLVLWHDHSTVAGAGYLLITIHSLYDPAIYLSTAEYERSSGRKCNRTVQEIVEEPELYMLSMSSSTLSDQLATIADRLDCLPDLNIPVYSSNNVPVNDSLKFFIGDHPAQSFERGSQVGGNYKCGSCGCKTSRIDDLAHVFNCTWRSLFDLQQLVLKGKYGNKPGILKPFAGLKKDELQGELRVRGVFDLSGKKDELSSMLSSILCGAQRVPTMLITDPKQPLSELNLDSYTIMDCEPLHDLKGHLINLLTELPFIFTGEHKTLVTELLQNILFSKKQNGFSGSDLRVALIEVNNLVQGQDFSVHVDIQLLLATAVKISERLYSSSDKRTPKTILQLYNCTWLHHELCKILFVAPKEITYGKFFGVYLHSLVAHAPIQYEIICLRSVNTENQERVFQQAKQIALNCTNRKPENVIPNIFLRLQAKGITGNLSKIYKSASKRVENVAKKSEPYKGMEIANSFIAERSHSWQAHLQRISSYLVSKEVWWKTTADGFRFLDSDSDTEYHQEGPSLNHFRSCSIQDIEERSRSNWKTVLDSKVAVPTNILRIFDDNWDLLSFDNGSRNGNDGPEFNGNDGPEFNGNDGPEFNGNDGPEFKGNDGPEFNGNDGPEFNGNDGPEFNGDDGPEINGDDGPEMDTNVSNNESLSGMKGNESLTDTNNSLVLGISPIRPLLSEKDVPAEKQVKSTPTTSKIDKTPMRQRVHQKQSTPCSSKKSLDNEDGLEDNYAIVLHEPSETTQYKSKHANLILMAIGDSAELALFDKLHAKLKAKSATRFEYNKYKDMEAEFQTQILKKKSALVEEIRVYENEFYKNHNSLPTSADTVYNKLSKNLRCVKTLLRNWKITV